MEATADSFSEFIDWLEMSLAAWNDAIFSIQHIDAGIKWQPFCRYFQMDFNRRKCLN